MKHVVSLLLPLLVAGCSFDSRPIWHDQRLPSGKTVKIVSFNLVWGVEHDERDPGKDSLEIDYVKTEPQADAAAHEREAREVFELIRPTCELWGFINCYVTALPQLDRKRGFEAFTFTRSSGEWSVSRETFDMNR